MQKSKKAKKGQPTKEQIDDQVRGKKLVSNNDGAPVYPSMQSEDRRRDKQKKNDKKSKEKARPQQDDEGLGAMGSGKRQDDN